MTSVQADKTDASTNKSTASSVSSMAPDIVVESSDGKKKSGSRKSKGSKKEKKFYVSFVDLWSLISAQRSIPLRCSWKTTRRGTTRSLTSKFCR